MTPRELIDRMLRKSRSAARSPNSKRTAGSTASRRSDTAHYLDGFAWPDGKFRFKPDWANVPFRSPYRSRAGRRDAGAAGPLGR